MIKNLANILSSITGNYRIVIEIQLKFGINFPQPKTHSDYYFLLNIFLNGIESFLPNLRLGYEADFTAKIWWSSAHFSDYRINK